jgi:hypothetical protein
VIDLPHGGAQFNEHDLVDYIRASRPPRDYIIQGHVKTTLANHPKRHSLDYWLRDHHSRHPDTMQAVTSVIDALVATGLFVAEEELLCPDSGRHCKGIRLRVTSEGNLPSR